MRRRTFLKHAGQLGLGSIALQGLPIKSFATASMLPLLDCQGINDRAMVVVFLKGANDGLNTIVPINQYDDYAAKRPTIKLPNVGQSNGLINLDTTLAIEKEVGIHPMMTAFKSMYESDRASIIQAVGYPSPNKSHFKSTDLWMTGGDGTTANFNIESGWLGRYLESAYPGVSGISTPEFPDPLGIQFGDNKPSGSLHNHDLEYLGINLTGQDPSNLFGLLNGLGSAPHTDLFPSDFSDQLSYIMNIENSTNSYGARISSVYNNGSNSSVTYPSTDLGNQLKSIARLMKGGSKTKVFLAHKSGFDTHVNQVVTGATSTGTHATLLADVFNCIEAFHADLANLGLENKVVTVTFSEFGRKVVQNANVGTDHGNFAPLFLFGSAVKSGVIGNNITINSITADGNLVETGANNQLQHDYRSIFKTLLRDWLGAGQTIIDQSMFGTYTTINNLIDTPSVVKPECYAEPICYNYVTSTQNDGNGSLRDIIACSPANAIIKIAVNDRIQLNGSKILIDKNIKIIQFNANTPSIKTVADAPIFEIMPNVSVELEGLTLTGTNLFPTIINNGTLKLTNCKIKKAGASINSTITNNGSLLINGNVVVGKE
jgi:uncharacterized protein (DUF1501 family)